MRQKGRFLAIRTQQSKGYERKRSKISGILICIIALLKREEVLKSSIIVHHSVQFFSKIFKIAAESPHVGAFSGVYLYAH